MNSRSVRHRLQIISQHFRPPRTKRKPPFSSSSTDPYAMAIVDHDDDYNFDLGNYSRRVTASEAAAQRWFNRGLIWCYAFNHEEAANCFTRATSSDKNCVMGYWGLAYALGPNYNKPWEFFNDAELATTVERTHKALKEAQRITAEGGANEVEEALVEAIKHRYPVEHAHEGDCIEWSVWNGKYADAMGEVYKRFPDDLDVATLYSDALMNLTPWKLWDVWTGQPAAGARTLEIQAVLEKALSQPGGDSHPGLLHLHIHLMEMCPNPEKALTMADKLRYLVPDAGHLNHMPSHLDVICGDYRRAVEANSNAIIADENYLKYSCGVLDFYTLYRSHNYHFRIYAAMFSGQSRIALTTLDQLENTVREDVLRVETPPMADWLEAFNAMRVHVYVRFGMWKELTEMPMPKDPKLYAVTTAMILYGKSIAHSSLNSIPEASAHKDKFLEAVENVPSTRTLFNNTAADLLAIASAMLDGELEYRKGNYGVAFPHLERAVQLDDNLPYDEPWGWMQPARHALGALLLEQNRVEDAAKVYSADLGFDDTLPRQMRHPNNVWSLHGFHECLVKLGRTVEAKLIEPQLKMALAVADVEIKTSCYCRTSCC